MKKQRKLELTRREYVYLKGLFNTLFIIALSDREHTINDVRDELISLRNKINKF